VPMDRSMACSAERNQVFFRVWATVTPKHLVVDFQIGHCAAFLTAPAVATSYLLPTPLIGPEIVWWAVAAQAATSKPLRNSCFWSSDRNRKNFFIEKASVSGSQLSRFAPARKSAQIISRQ
jgi:hypothetical protein